MSTLVLLGERPLAVEFADLLDHLVNPAAAEEKEQEKTLSAFGKLAKDKKIADLIDQGVFKNEKVILAANDEEFASVLSFVLSLIPSLPAASIPSTVQRLSSLLTSSKDRSVLRLKQLTTLLNSTSAQGISSGIAGISATIVISPEERFTLLQSVLQYAVDTQQAHLVHQPLNSWNSLVANWQLNKAQASATLLIAYNIAKAVHSQPVVGSHIVVLPSHLDEYVLAYLQSLNESSKLSAEAKALVLESVTKALTSPLDSTTATAPLDATRFLTLNVFASAKAAEVTGLSAQWLQLLRLAGTAKTDELTQFLEKEKSFVTANKIHGDVLIRKAKITIFCDLAKQAQLNQIPAPANTNSSTPVVLPACGNDRLSYAHVQKTLGLKDSAAVEDLVIDAVMSGRFEGKMDQEQESILIKRVVGLNQHILPFAVGGEEEKKQWTILANKLAAWRGAMEGLLNSFASQAPNAAGLTSVLQPIEPAAAAVDDE